MMVGDREFRTLDKATSRFVRVGNSLSYDQSDYRFIFRDDREQARE